MAFDFFLVSAYFHNVMDFIMFGNIVVANITT